MNDTAANATTPAPTFTITFAEGTIGDDMAALALPQYAFEAVLDRTSWDFIESKEFGYRKVWVTARWGNGEALEMRLDINGSHPTRVVAIVQEKITLAEMMLQKGNVNYKPFLTLYKSLLAAIIES